MSKIAHKSPVTRLKRLREQRDLTQQQAADALGVDITTYRSWEKGKREPSPFALSQLADFFNVSADYLLGHSRYTNVGNKEIAEITGLSQESIDFLRLAQKWREAANRSDDAAENLKSLIVVDKILADSYRNTIKTLLFIDRILSDAGKRIAWDEDGEPAGVSTLFSMMEDYISLHAAEDNPEKFRLETDASTLVLGRERVTELALYVEMERIERKLQTMREEHQGGKKDG